MSPNEEELSSLREQIPPERMTFGDMKQAISTKDNSSKEPRKKLQVVKK